MKSDDFLTLSPRGKVPLLEDDGFVLPESMAAIAYLDRKHPEQTLFGATPEETGKIWHCVLDFDLYVSEHWVNNIIAPIVTGQAEQAQATIQQGAKDAHRELAKLEKNLSDRDWFVGSGVSAADIAIYPLLEALVRFATKPAVSHLDLGFDRFDTDYPQLNNWRKRIQELPGYNKTYPDYWRETDAGG